jgi:hypothetical protein
MTKQMLSDEMASQVSVQRPFAVGDLVVATDYKGREVGGTVKRIAQNGDPTVRCSGLDTTDMYFGATVTFDASKVRRAV